MKTSVLSSTTVILDLSIYPLILLFAMSFKDKLLGE